MGKLIWPILSILIFAGVAYILYLNGYLVVNAKKAVTFIGTQRCKKARFSGCSGYIKRVVRLDADKLCTFTLAAELAKGEMSVQLIDNAGQEVLCLNGDARSAAIVPEKGQRYYLVIRFRAATGEYQLDWE